MVDTSSTTVIEKVQLQKGVKTQKRKTDEGSVLAIDNSSDENKNAASSDEDKRNRKCRRTVAEKSLHENRKTRKFWEKTTCERDEKMSNFMAELLVQGNDMKATMDKAVESQVTFNNQFFQYLQSRK